ncbi:MAG: extracellular solute-binding protein [Deltaproteobacteria bacterium]|nr:MAG: extracellular solute-binding protein [Deltaproteobacteria bacterium]
MKKIAYVLVITLTITGLMLVCPPAATSKAAWEQKWDKAVAEAKKEGAVVIYSDLAPAPRGALAKAFKESLGINMEFVVASGAELTTKILFEKRARLSFADAIISGGTTFINLTKGGLVLQPLDSFLILPEVTDPKAYLNEVLPFMDKDHKVILLIAGFRTYLVVNTNMVKEGEIKSYVDLLNPKWKGKMVLDDPTVPGPGNAFATEFLAKIWDEERGKKFLQDLIKQEPVIARDRRMTVEWVARGKYPIGLGTFRDMTAQFILNGAPLKFVRVAEGGEISGGAGHIALPDRLAHPNAATVFLNWLLSKEGATTLAKSYGSPSIRTDVPTTGIYPFFIPVPGEKAFYNAWDWYLIQPRLTEIVKELFAPVSRK